MTQHLSRRGVLIGGAVGLAATAASGTAAMSSPVGGTHRADLALTGATVVDAARTRPLRDATVLIRGTRIVAVGRRRDVRVPHGATVVDLSGKYLIPGLCDVHAHSFGSERISPPLYIANGVTTVREMAASPVVSGWRHQIERGTLLGPRWSIGSTIIDGSPSLLVDPSDPDGAILVTDEAEARRAVRRVKAEGADFVKVYSRLSEAAYLAIADEAHRQGISFVGHGPDTVSIDRVISAGQRTIEHVHTLWFGASSRDAEVRALLARIRIEPGDYAAWFRQVHPVEWLATSNFSPTRAAAIFDRLLRHRTYVTPTLLMHQIVDHPEGLVLDDERLRYVPAETREWWRWAVENIYLAGRSPEEVAQQRELWKRRLRFVGELHRAGVPLLAGTEAGLVYAYPGISIHDELALLVEAGLSPLEALRSATLTAAAMLGLRDAIGSVERGKLADLVVLDADPLADIRNTAKVHSVLVRGRYVSSAQRVAMLADVERAAQEPPDETPVAATGCGCHMPRITAGRRAAIRR